MSTLPNVAPLSQKYQKGREFGNEFARILTQLLIVDSKKQGYQLVTFDDASGDIAGLDAYSPFGFPGIDGVVGFQFKFYPSPIHKGNYAHQIQKSISAAMQMARLKLWILVTLISPKQRLF